jgi:hypothetical protein
MPSDRQTGEQALETLDARTRIVWLVLAALGGLIIGLGAVWALNQFVVSVEDWVGPILAGSLVLLGCLYALVRYRNWRFDIQEDALYLEHGVLTYVESVVPFVRIQNVDTQRGPLERLVGLSSVVVYTAGVRGADVTIPGLPPERARLIRERLRDRAVESERADGV